jgi:hypothetical protein
MSTLESQYKEFIKLNPRADLSFEEWEKINARLVKQALVNMMKADEDLGLYDEETEPQETLEEAEKEFEKLLNGKGLPTKQLTEVAEHYFIIGYEIAKERSYSEVFEWLASKDYLSDKVDVIQKEFGEFKKK